MPDKYVVICVDDEEVVLRSLKEQLKRFLDRDRFDVETFPDAEHALEAVTDILDEGTEIPLVISDEIMPGMKGHELLRIVHEKSPDTLKVLLTGQATAEAIGDVVNHARLYRYISKPWAQDDLTLTAQEAIRSYEQTKQIEAQRLQLIAYNEQLEKKVAERTEALASALATLKKQNEDIRASIHYASRIQKAMLPLPEKMDELFPEHFVLYKPRDVVSGDFYWVEELADGFVVAGASPSHKVIVAVADCTGHGVPGAFMSMIGHNLLSEVVNNLHGHCAPDLILSGLHARIRIVLKQEETGTHDGMDMSICVIDPQTREVCYAGAKNALYYVQNSQLFEVHADKMPIGGHGFLYKGAFTMHAIPSDKSVPLTLYMFSDGYPDQFGGEQRRKFTSRRFRELLLNVSQLPPNEQKERLNQTIEQWKADGHEPQIDDITVLGIRI